MRQLVYAIHSAVKRVNIHMELYACNTITQVGLERIARKPSAQMICVDQKANVYNRNNVFAQNYGQRWGVIILKLNLTFFKADDGSCYSLRVSGLKGAAISLVVLIISILACQGGYKFVHSNAQNNSWVGTNDVIITDDVSINKNISTHKPT